MAQQSELERKRLARVGLGVDFSQLVKEKEEKEEVKVFTGYCYATPEHKLLKRLIRTTDGWTESTKLAEAQLVWISAQHELTDYELHGLRKRKCWFSRYMGSREVCSKRTFFGILNCAKTIFPDKFNRFIPKTWFFPEDKQKLLHEI